jgi:hypothetical protein
VSFRCSHKRRGNNRCRWAGIYSVVDCPESKWMSIASLVQTPFQGVSYRAAPGFQPFPLTTLLELPDQVNLYSPAGQFCKSLSGTILSPGVVEPVVSPCQSRSSTSLREMPQSREGKHSSYRTEQNSKNRDGDDDDES